MYRLFLELAIDYAGVFRENSFAFFSNIKLIEYRCYISTENCF